MSCSLVRFAAAVLAAAGLAACGTTVASTVSPDASTPPADGGAVHVDGGVSDGGFDGGFNPDAGLGCGAGLVLCSDGFTCIPQNATCPQLPTCAVGETICPATATFPSFCALIITDPNNCGSCGRVCGLGQVCLGGACQTR
jgi:hypothetical protein